MISSMMLLFVAGALLTLYVDRLSEQNRLERGERIGHALAILGAGLEAYIHSHYATLAADQPSVPGVRDALRPTAAELIRLVNIKGVADVPPAQTGAAYRFHVYSPGSCLPSQRTGSMPCRLTGLAYIDKPILRGQTEDYVALGRAVRVMKGRGGYSRLENPRHFAFADGGAAQVPVPVPNPTLMAGVLAWRADSLLGNNEFLNTNGSNRMNGTLRLDGQGGPHDLAGVRTLTASETLAARTLSIAGDSTVHGSSTVLGSAMINGNSTVNGNSAVVGNLEVQGNTITKGQLNVDGGGVSTEDLLVHQNAKVKKDLTVKGRVVVKGGATFETLGFSRSFQPGAQCRAVGQIGMSADEELLLCTKGKRWRALHSGQASS